MEDISSLAGYDGTDLSALQRLRQDDRYELVSGYPMLHSKVLFTKKERKEGGRIEGRKEGRNPLIREGDLLWGFCICFWRPC